MKGWQLAAALCPQKIFCKNKNLFASKVQIKIAQVTKEVLDKSAALMFAVIYQPQANLTIMKAPPHPSQYWNKLQQAQRQKNVCLYSLW